jgi:hypothetical protein
MVVHVIHSYLAAITVTHELLPAGSWLTENPDDCLVAHPVTQENELLEDVSRFIRTTRTTAEGDILQSNVPFYPPFHLCIAALTEFDRPFLFRNGGPFARGPPDVGIRHLSSHSEVRIVDRECWAPQFCLVTRIPLAMVASDTGARTTDTAAAHSGCLVAVAVGGCQTPCPGAPHLFTAIHVYDFSEIKDRGMRSVLPTSHQWRLPAALVSRKDRLLVDGDRLMACVGGEQWQWHGGPIGCPEAKWIPASF